MMESLTLGNRWGLASGTIVLLVFTYLVVGFLRTYVWKPNSIRKKMEAQGISGPAPSLITGNLLEIEALRAETWSTPMCKPGQVDHDYVSHLFPHYKLWGEKYGSKFVMWWGEEPAILETDLNRVLEVFGSKHDGAYGKYSRWEATLATAIGQGLAIVNGLVWLKRRRLAQPAFHADNVKVLAGPMVDSATTMVAKWKESHKAAEGEWTYNVAEDLIGVAADVISRSALHTTYENSQEIFRLQLEALKLSFESIAWSFIPFYSYLPFPRNFRRWKVRYQLESKVARLIKSAIKAVESQSGFVPKDLLGLLVTANKDPENVSAGLKFTNQNLMDEIRTILSAGFDTISASFTWTLLCLATNPIWQERVYEEIKEVCGDGTPDGQTTPKLKVLGMVINESMRLYPAAPQLARTAVKDVKLGDIVVPKGLSVFLCTPIIHRLPEVWGSDANEFKPERFKDGVASATSNPLALMPFSFGPRSCVAKNFAMMELKIVLSIIIQSFEFKLSPTYLHNPIMEGVVVKNKDGLPLILTPRNSTTT